MDEVGLFNELSGWKFHLLFVLAWEHPQVTDLPGGAIPLSFSPHQSSLACRWLCIHSASFLINSPNLSLFTTPVVVWGVWPRCFPQASRITFQVSSEQMFPFFQFCSSPQLLKPSFAQESTSYCCRVFDQESMSRNKRIPHWWLFGRQLLGVCMLAPSSLCSHYSCEQMFSTDQLAVLSLPPYTNASAHSPAMDGPQFTQDSSTFHCLE